MKKNLIFFLAFLSFLGFLDASYLTFNYYQNQIPPCQIDGCEDVLTSKYSKIFNLPISLFGSFYYLTLFLLALLFFRYQKKIFLNIFAFINFLGFFISLFLMYLMFFVIKSFCLYCFSSFIVSTVIFIIMIYFYYEHFRKHT